MHNLTSAELLATTSKAAEWLGTVMLCEVLALVAVATWLQA